jgi:hypothetical protein
MTKRTRTADRADRAASNTRDGVTDSRGAAEYIGTTEAQLATLRYRNAGPVYIRTPGGRTIRYRWSDIDAWLDAGRVETDNGGGA